MIDQLTVFLENREGRLSAMTRAISQAGVDMLALTIAETSDYGLVRIICNDPAKAREALDAAGFHASLTKVAAVAVPNRPGGLADLLETLDEINLNIEYGYCFSLKEDLAVDVLKIHGAEEAAGAIEAAGFKLLSAGDLY